MKLLAPVTILLIAIFAISACAPQATPTPEPTVVPTPEMMDIVDTAVADGRFTTLVAAVQAAGLVDALKAEGPLTVFAPTDDAFAKLPEGTVESLLLVENIEQLKSILLYHVVEGKVMAADVAGLTSATTLLGKDVTVKVDMGDVYINDAKVIITDIETSNGVIHVIDKVLLPPAGSTAAAAAPAAPANGFTAPAEGATISGKVDITGNANDADFMKWQLDLLPAEKEANPHRLPLGQ